MARSLAAFCLAAAFACASASASAQQVGAADARAAGSVVAAQLDAFANDDAERAFSYAAPAIRTMFGTPERFMAMVRAGYPAVYRATSVTFLVPQREGEEIVQGVRLTDREGALWLATYRLERQRDGAWRIKGCDVQPASGKLV